MNKKPWINVFIQGTCISLEHYKLKWINLYYCKTPFFSKAVVIVTALFSEFIFRVPANAWIAVIWIWNTKSTDRVHNWLFGSTFAAVKRWNRLLRLRQWKDKIDVAKCMIPKATLSFHTCSIRYMHVAGETHSLAWIPQVMKTRGLGAWRFVWIWKKEWNLPLLGQHRAQ